MTLVVSRDENGDVKVNFTDGSTSVWLSEPAASVQFSDAFPAPAPAPDVEAPAPAEPAAASATKEDAAPAAVDELPFKCPACGATYDVQIDCTNQHPAATTLPTADVLAGVPAPTAEDPTPPAAADASTAQPSQEASSQESPAQPGPDGGAAEPPPIPGQ